MGDMEIPDELIDQLLGEYRGPEQLTGPDGLINQLRRRLIERAAGAELEQHLGYPPGAEPPEAQPNRRNGTTSKTLRTVDGPVTVELPRDRDASFEPRIVPKHARSFDGFDEQILALYAGGMTTREIQRHLRELYGVDVSEGLISEVTASIQDDVRAWQSRPLEELYVVVYLDAMQVAIATNRSSGRRPSTSRSASRSTASVTVSASGSKRTRAPASGRACSRSFATAASRTSSSSAPTASRASPRRSMPSSR
jgi:putative transposase